jgi:hypothetical protein
MICCPSPDFPRAGCVQSSRPRYPRRVRHLAKIDRQGNVHWDWKLVAPRELDGLIGAATSILYYFEAPELAPTGEQLATLERLRRATVPVLDGGTEPSEWGTLQWFELEEAPFTMRLAIVPDQPILFAAKEKGQAEASTWIVDAEPARIAEVSSAIDFLIRANRVVETRPNEPAKVFAKAAQQTPSLHVRISYGGERRWMTYHPTNDVPQNIRAFQAGCLAYGLEHLTGAAKKVSGADALRFLGRNRN